MQLQNPPWMLCLICQQGDAKLDSGSRTCFRSHRKYNKLCAGRGVVAGAVVTIGQASFR